MMYIIYNSIDGYLWGNLKYWCMDLTIPDSLPTSETTIYQDEQVTITLVDFTSSGGDVYITMYIENHAEFPEIVPDNTRNCSLYDGRDELPSRVSKLSAQNCKIIMRAVDQVMDEHELELANPQKGYGICDECMGDGDNCGRLRFSATLKDVVYR